MNLHGYMAELRDEINEELMRQIECPTDAPILIQSMLYSVENGGKRFRPILLLMMLEAFGVERIRGMQTAIALEMIHTYSLIHDDLPAMDNDDFRRGKPTNHKVYGEAMAILAGDGLLTDAFRIIVEDVKLSAEVRLGLIQMLSMYAGVECGMITGQVLDMQAEEKSVSLEELKKIHYLKTGALIEYACQAAGMIATQDNDVALKLRNFANALGLAFQIQDDILDVEGDMEKIGKSVGSDVANGKSTYVSLLGLNGAKEMLIEEVDKALAILDALPADTVKLKELTLYVAHRDR